MRGVLLGSPASLFKNLTELILEFYWILKFSMLLFFVYLSPVQKEFVKVSLHEVDVFAHLFKDNESHVVKVNLAVYCLS